MLYLTLQDRGCNKDAHFFFYYGMASLMLEGREILTVPGSYSKGLGFKLCCAQYCCLLRVQKGRLRHRNFGQLDLTPPAQWRVQQFIDAHMCPVGKDCPCIRLPCADDVVDLDCCS